MGNKISYGTIVLAKSGDSNAMQSILRYYEHYINLHALRTFYDEYGTRHEIIDDDIRQRIEAKLIYQIIQKFDHTRTPNGEEVDL